MTRSLRFVRYPECIPPDGAEIFYIEVDEFNGTYGIPFGKIDWAWHAGNGGTYDHEVEGSELRMQIGSTVLPASFLWCSASAVDQLVDSNA